MEYIKDILGQQNQAQSVEEAIPTLCNRLQHASMSSDRRSAVLGLKSFSRQYRETVVEHGLKSLISTFKRDIDNSVIVKSILETFLILLIRGETDEDLTRGWISQQSRLQNGKYPSPLLMDKDVSIDQLSLWIADALIQDQEFLQLLIEEVLSKHDYHLKLYTIQLLESLVSSRSTRTKECLLNIPTSISTICNSLNDTHEPVRNEAILLLMAVVNDNFNLQKLVAFENTFEKLFDIIEEEGGIRGSILVQDCLTLITNLLQFNASNQKFFLETQCVPKLAHLLGEPVDETGDPNLLDENGFPSVPPPIVWTEQRRQNMIIALEICRLLVSEDTELVGQNQDKLFHSGIHYIVLKLVFSPITDNKIRSIALLTAGDCISGNAKIQYEFSKIDVPYMDPSLPSQIQLYDKPVSVPLALLNWCLYINSVHAFEIRVGAAFCLNAYFKDNSESKSAFLNDQIKAYETPGYFETLMATKEMVNGEEADNESIMNGNCSATPFGNIFVTLMDYDAESKLNPYKVWFAALTLIYLFVDEPDNKEIARKINTGDAEAGEEVMNSIQAISELLITTLESVDQRISIGYIMLLTIWMYEDCNAVNDFLSDQSYIRSILAFLSNNLSEENVLVHGMATILLGVVYEFSSKDSPFPRSELHALLVKSFGKDNYSLKIKQFKANPSFNDFEEASAFRSIQEDQTGLPDVYFDVVYVTLVKENFYRIKRALFHDPMNEPRGKISYEAFEELETQVSKMRKELDTEKENSKQNDTSLTKQINELDDLKNKLQSQIELKEQELSQLKVDHESVRAKFDEATTNLAKMKTTKEEFEKSSSKYFKELQEVSRKSKTNADKLIQLEDKLNTVEVAKKKLEEGVNNMTKDLFQMRKQKNEGDSRIKQLEKELKVSKDEFNNLKVNCDAQILKLNSEKDQLKAKLNDATNHVVTLNKEKDSIAKESKSIIKDHDETNNHLMDKLRSASQAFQELRQSNNSLQEENEKSKADFEKLQSEFNNLQNSLNSMETEKKDILLKMTKAEKSNDERIKQLEEKSSKVLQEKSSEISKLNEEIKHKLKEIESLKSSSSTMENEYETKIQALEKRNKELSNSHEDTKASESSIKDEFNKLKKEFETTKASMSKQIQSKSNDHDELAKVLQEKESAFDKLQTALDTLKTSTKEEILNKDKELEDKSLILSELQKEFNNHKLAKENEHNKSKKELEKCKSSLESLQQKFEDNKVSLEKSHEKAITKVNDELSNANKTLSDTKFKLDETNAQITKQLNNIDGLEQKSKNSLQELKGMKSEKTKLENQLKEKDSLAAKQSDKIAQLSSKFEEFSMNLESLQTEKSSDLKKMQSNIKELKDSKKYEIEKLSSLLEEQKLELSATINSKATELTLLNDNFAKESKSLKSDIESKSKLITSLKTELKDKNEELEKERKMLSENSETVIKEYADKIKLLESKIVSIKEDHSKEIEKCENEKSNLEASIQEITQKNTDTESELDKLNKKLMTAEANLTKHQSEHSSAVDLSTKENKLLVKEIESLKKTFKEKEQEILALSKSHESHLDQLQSKHSTESIGLEKNIEGLKSTLKNLEKERKDLKEQLMFATDSESSTKAKLEELRMELAKQLDRNAAAEEKLSSKFEELNKSKAKSKELEENYKTLQGDYESQRKDHEEINSSLTSMKHEVVELQNDKENVDLELKLKIDKISELDSELKALQFSKESFDKTQIEEMEKIRSELSAAKKESEERRYLVETKTKELEQIKKIESELQSKVEKIENSLKLAKVENDQLRTKNKKLDANSNKYDEAIIIKDELEQKLKDNTQELRKSEATITELENQLNSSLQSENDDSLQKEISTLKEQNRDITDKLSKSVSQKEAFETEVTKLKEKLSKFVSKTEYDDLMLLVSDLDDKTKKYKQKLKKLGEDVSSDEESEYEDEDDEDNDDNNDN